MRATAVLSISALLFGAGCVSSAEPGARARHGCPEAADTEIDPLTEAPDAHTFAARVHGAPSLLLRVEHHGVFGPNVSLGRFEEGGLGVLRGRVDKDIVDLRISDERVTGSIGNSPVDVLVWRGETHMTAKGLIPGRLSRFRVDETSLRGRIGDCSYDLARTSQGFAGRRICGERMRTFSLHLPALMASWTDAEVAAVFAALLRKP